ANGSGKSTLLKSLLGADAIEQGEILGDGVPIVRDDSWRRTIAYLPQRPFLGERSSAREAFVLFGAPVENSTMRHWLERLALWDVLARKNSDDPLSTRVGALSSGERQRLALARFFSLDRDTYLLDEPDANLDAAGVAAVVEIVAELAKTKRVIVAAHTPELVRVGRTVLELEDGRARNPSEPVNVLRRADNPLQGDA
ncbi:MAG: ATP-binding cassette domain-containing protein, partial [Polyangiaceae bacterium]